LNHIIGFTQLILDKRIGALNETQEEYLGDTLQSSRHLLSLINDILDLSKVESGRRELELTKVNLHALLEDSMTIIREQARIREIQLSLDAGEIPDTIRADERLLKQVLYNLLSNAIKFTPPGGWVNVSVECTNGGQGTARTTGAVRSAAGRDSDSELSDIMVCVSDNGIGIKKSDLDRIFIAFEQVETSLSRKYHGTGLGLSLSKQLAELHGGRLWAESDGEGKGARFFFAIPAG
jgi:signal transduction histidine kinase